MEDEARPATNWLTSTQIGAVAEALVASGLILASCGRLAPFRPIADDTGHDLLVYDKLTKRCVPVQIKCRTGPDGGKGGTVQFDVRLNTFTRDGGGVILCALMEDERIRTCWLIPAAELEDVSKRSSDKLSIVASPKPASRDRYTAYRRESLTEVAQALVRRLEA